jgi:hypothetical protein
VAGVAYNYGYNKAYHSRSRPIYIKYTNNVNKSLSVSLQNAGIFAEPAKVEKFGKMLKEGGKRAR